MSPGAQQTVVRKGTEIVVPVRTTSSWFCGDWMAKLWKPVPKVTVCEAAKFPLDPSTVKEYVPEATEFATAMETLWVVLPNAKVDGVAVTPEGSPENETLTLPAKPPAGTTAIRIGDEVPGAIAREDGLTTKEKEGVAGGPD